MLFQARAERLVASVFLLKGSLVVVDNELDAVELSAEERKLLYEHLARCAVSPNYLGSPKVTEPFPHANRSTVVGGY